jgi:hypothetical protein
MFLYTGSLHPIFLGINIGLLANVLKYAKDSDRCIVTGA